MRRRDFLSGLGGVVAAGAARTSAVDATVSQLISPLTPPRLATWRDLPSQFHLPADYAYFNTAGLGSSPRVVTSRVKTMMDREEEAPSPGHSEEDWKRTRTKCAALLGPGCQGDEIALVSTATEGINVILNGLPLHAGDEVVTSTHEHPALAIPLLHKIKTAGIVVKTFAPDLASRSGTVERIAALLTPRTRLIFVSHVTCTTGQILPVEDIGRLAAARRLWFALDGAQSLAQFPIDIVATGAHFYTASGHKWLLGPKRTGILYVSRDQIAGLEPSIPGAYSDQSHSLADLTLTLQSTAQRFEYGTQNDALIYGLDTALDYIAGLGLPAIWDYNRNLADRCLAGLRKVPGLEILSPDDAASRSAVISCRLSGRDNRQVAGALTGKRFRVRSVTEAGLDAVRVSFHVYNTESQVRALIGAITALAEGRGI